jgi:hypothetical protein
MRAFIEQSQAEASKFEHVAIQMRSALKLPQKPLATLAQESESGRRAPTLRVKARQFSGTTKSFALEYYMRERRDLGPIPIPKIISDLMAGDCYLGPFEDRWDRILMAIARERPRVFALSQDKTTIALAPTAFDRPVPKSRGQKKKKTPD